MQIQFRKNPPTTGWAKYASVALLAGLAAFALSVVASFVPFLHHFETAYPTDTQNLLSALTASVVLGVAMALLALTFVLVFATLLHLRRR